MIQKDATWDVWKKMIIIIVLIWLASAVAAWYFTGEDIGTGNVAAIDIAGPITVLSSGYGSGGTTSTEVLSLIDEVKANPEIKAVLFRINSPGGSPVASDEIGQAIKSLDIPTVALIQEVGASGGYWVASATDHIIANRMSITGSIGVIGSYLEFSGLLERYNVTYQRFVSAAYKDFGSPFRNITDEERELFQQQIDLIHSFFVDEVAQNRNMSRERVEAIADGLFMTGYQAYEAGLVDELGNTPEAVAYLERQLNTSVEIVNYEVERSIYDLLTGLAAKKPDLGVMEGVRVVT